MLLCAAAPVTYRPPVDGPVTYRPPVDGPVLARFVAPEHPYGPGHRGVDLGAAPGTPVGAAAAGQVTFAGPVAGVRWVTVRHADGIRTTVGPLAEVLVGAGDRVARGAPLGTSGRAHGLAAVHLSARRGETYLDPLLLLGGRPRLLPPDAGPVRLAAPARLTARPPPPGVR